MARRRTWWDEVETYAPWVLGGLVVGGTIAWVSGAFGSGSLFVIPIENHGLDQTIGNPNLPYLNQLASSYAYCTNYTTRVHPSLPNYLLMTSGQTWGVTDDAYHLIPGDQNVFAQMTAAGVPWRAYAQSMGRPCRTTDSEVYASRHNPAVYYDSVVNGGACAQQVVDLSQLPADLASGTPRFVWITPDLQNDWHDGTAAQLDAFLSQWVPLIMGSSAYQSGGTLVIVADENDSGTLVPAIVVSSRLAQAPFQDPTAYDQRSLCATIQDLMGVPRLPATAGINSLASMLR